MLWKKYPRGWMWLNIVLASTLVFWLSDWDLRISGWFYDPGYAGQEWWLERHRLMYYLFYKSVPWISGIILFGSLLIITITSLGRNRRSLRLRALRLQTVYVLLVFLLGPGLLVNAVFKEHWGRVRPVEAQAFGGTGVYTPPLQYVSGSDGRSFPSGHSSIGFAFIAFWFVWRRRYPLRARRVLVFSLLFGSLIGLTRIAAGGHYLSDVIWSMWMVMFVAWCLSVYLLESQSGQGRVGKL